MEMDKRMPKLTHLNNKGEAHMVDVSAKLPSLRVARAQATVRMQPATLKAIQADELKKGDVLSVARIAGIQAAKKCADLIPLCHPLALTRVSIDFDTASSETLVIHALVQVTGQTGVEMEALTAASVSALTVYDMCKAIDRGMVIENVLLLSKSGGVSGDFDREEGASLDDARHPGHAGSSAEDGTENETARD